MTPEARFAQARDAAARLIRALATDHERVRATAATILIDAEERFRAALLDTFLTDDGPARTTPLEE